MNSNNNKGIALLAVLIVMIIGLMLSALGFYLIGRGNQTYGSMKNYTKALNIAQGGVEEAITLLEYHPYEFAESKLGIEQDSDSGGKYTIWKLFWKPLSGFGGAITFPPVSGAYSGVAGVGVFYLVHSEKELRGAKADLYTMYVKGY